MRKRGAQPLVRLRLQRTHFVSNKSKRKEKQGDEQQVEKRYFAPYLLNDFTDVDGVDIRIPCDNDEDDSERIDEMVLILQSEHGAQPAQRREEKQRYFDKKG